MLLLPRWHSNKAHVQTTDTSCLASLRLPVHFAAFAHRLFWCSRSSLWEMDQSLSQSILYKLLVYAICLLPVLSLLIWCRLSRATVDANSMLSSPCFVDRICHNHVRGHLSLSLSPQSELASAACSSSFPHANALWKRRIWCWILCKAGL